MPSTPLRCHYDRNGIEWRLLRLTTFQYLKIDDERNIEYGSLNSFQEFLNLLFEKKGTH